jgi:hypothetical protein
MFFHQEQLKLQTAAYPYISYQCSTARPWVSGTDMALTATGIKSNRLLRAIIKIKG